VLLSIQTEAEPLGTVTFRVGLVTSGLPCPWIDFFTEGVWALVSMPNEDADDGLLVQSEYCPLPCTGQL
jgi:hypothetical protein